MRNKKCKKTGWLTENEAMLKLEKIKLESTRKVKPIRAYKCHCNLWHLTSRLDIKDIEAENAELKDKIKVLEKKIIDISKQKDSNLDAEMGDKIYRSLFDIYINFIDWKRKKNLGNGKK